MYNTILFDLDGTLTDSALGITNSVMYALDKMKIPVGDRSEYYKFVGPPLVQSFQKYYNFTEDETRLGVSYFREYFTEKGIFENRVYEGVEDVLRKLYEQKIQLCVATSKPEQFARQILERFHLAPFFSFVGGSTMEETRTDKAEVIQYVLDAVKIKEPGSVLMVGDREHDVIGAKKNGLASLGVLYGYGDREELERAGADFIVERPEDILR